jgi:Putative S-adenosyl-L-methionine-dependent methyltransferase
MADNLRPAGVSKAVLETSVPLSQSVIWRLQSDYYAQRGLKAWTEDEVPSYITNNPFIAEVYAGVVAAFFQDSLGHATEHSQWISPENPLRILELGAGTGKFSYLFLRKLLPLLREANIPPQTVRYLMTDCSEELVAHWRRNDYLRQFSSAGILEFEVFRAGSDDAAGIFSPAKAGAAPLVVIANYFFDSLPQDAFGIHEGEISEALVTSSGGSSEGPPSLDDVQLSFTNDHVSPQRYKDPVWNAILHGYSSRLPSATLFFPSATLALLQQLKQVSDGRMLVLAADKGFAYEQELALAQGPPVLEFHASRRCFSAMVNLHAISSYFAATGGLALLPPKHFTNLNVCAFVTRRPQDEFLLTRKAYQQAVEAFGPDDLFTVMSWLNAYLDNISVPQALALLRLTRWDTTAFLRLFPAVAPKLRSVVAERNDLREAVLRVWENRYPVSPTDNLLAFNCGVVLLELRFHAAAAEMFKLSEQLMGKTATTSYNRGLCALGLEDRAQALTHMREACRLDPAFEAARSSRERLEIEITSN